MNNDNNNNSNNYVNVIITQVKESTTDYKFVNLSCINYVLRSFYNYQTISINSRLSTIILN